MGITRTIIVGISTWGLMSLFHTPHDIRLGVSIFTAFMSESILQSSIRGELKHKASNLQNELNISIIQLTDMKVALDQTTKELKQALEELYRRDAIGSPAARELLKRQEDAMGAQKVALEMSNDRSVETLESLERMIIAQGHQTARVQEVLSVVLEKLALEPRQNITMRDSVLMQEKESIPGMTDDIIAQMA
ncbi:MAG: hypothetical protein QGI21_05235 [Candidatus Poseidoniaceae archaeon]|jgi:hypothetical protein|nr:hypothetical protein [Candidatus Poseidoniaceae archaeon]